MRFKGFIGASYTLQSLNVDCQRAVNLYPEMNEMGTGNEGEVASLVSTPGLNLLVTLPTGPVRGVYTDSTGQLWAVGGNTLYQVSSSWVATAYGTLLTSTGYISFSDNGIQAVLVDGAYGYYWFIGSLSQTSTATAAGTTTLTVSSTPWQGFTGTTTQAVVLPDVSTLEVGSYFYVENTSTGVVTVKSSGSNAIQAMASGSLLALTCIAITGTGTASWEWTYVTNHVTGSSFAQITDTSFQGATQVTFMDSYLIFNKPNTQEFYLSPLAAVLPFNGLAVGSAEAAPDKLIGLIALQEQLYLFSQEHTEVFYDTGNFPDPFSRIQGAVIEIGCMAAFSIAKIGNSVYWLGQDENGRGVVYTAQGLQASRISTFAIEQEIVALGDLSNARAWTYQQAGHFFYCLNLPGDTRTWCYDVSTGLWHERAYLTSGEYSRHLADCHAYAYSKNVVGDYSSGNVYSLERTVFSDNGNPIVRERAAPHISKDLIRLFHSMFQLDLQSGVGIDGSGQGSDPQAILDWSDDFGNSWSNEHWVSIGKIGARRSRAQWWRLGVARDRVYRVRISDPVSVTLLGAEIEIEAGVA